MVIDLKAGDLLVVDLVGQVFEGPMLAKGNFIMLVSPSDAWPHNLGPDDEPSAWNVLTHRGYRVLAAMFLEICCKRYD